MAYITLAHTGGDTRMPLTEEGPLMPTGGINCCKPPK